MKMACSILGCVLLLLISFFPQAGNTLPLRGEGSGGSFQGTLSYTWDASIGQAILEVVLTNACSVTDRRHITGFAFNNPGEIITDIAFSDSVFGLLGAPTFANAVRVPSMGIFDIGVAMGGSWEAGGSMEHGIGIGQTKRFTFLLSGSSLHTLKEGHFIGEHALGSHHYFVVRFANFETGENGLVSAEAIAPVTISSLTATGRADHIELRWISQSEIGVRAYRLYRGQTEDTQLTEIAHFKAQGNPEGSSDYHYVDKNVVQGKKYYYYKLAVEDFGGQLTFHGPVFAAASSSVPRQYKLSPAFPNPFNVSTAIGYQLPSAGQVTLTIYDVLGRKVRHLVDGSQKVGHYTISWDGKDDTGQELKSGVYFCIFEARKFSETMKLTMTR